MLPARSAESVHLSVWSFEALDRLSSGRTANGTKTISIHYALKAHLSVSEIVTQWLQLTSLISSPATITLAPYTLQFCIFIMGATFGMTTVTLMLSSWPWYARAKAWLPALAAITPTARCALGIFSNMLRAPLSLKLQKQDKLGWKDSRETKTSEARSKDHWFNLWPWRTLTQFQHALCEFAIGVSHEAGGSSALNKIAKRAYKACADWLNLFYSPWESAGYKVDSQNNQLHLTWNLVWASLGAVIIAEKETIAIHENRSIRSDFKMKSDQIYLRAAASWVWLGAQSPRMISSDRTKLRHNTNYTVSLAPVLGLREILLVRE